MSPELARLLPLLQATPDAVAAAFLVFLRVGAMIALVPGFGETLIPMRIRLIAALSFTAITLPAVLPALPRYADLTLPMALNEAVVGLALGLCARWLLAALQIAGAILAQAIALSQLFGQLTAEAQPALSNLLSMAGTCLWFAGGFHSQLALSLIQSYAGFPAGGGPVPTGDLAQWAIAHIRFCFGLAFCLAAPVTIAAALFNLALGVANRAMPMLPVTMIAAPAQIGLGLAALALVVPLLLAVWQNWSAGILATPFALPP